MEVKVLSPHCHIKESILIHQKKCFREECIMGILNEKH